MLRLAPPAQIPVYAVMVEDLGLRGSHRLAWKILKEEVAANGGRAGDTSASSIKKVLIAGVVLAGLAGVFGALNNGKRLRK